MSVHSQRVEKYLDAGYGACHMKDPRVAQLVRDALLHFDGQRYDLLAWCVMPNHVHAVVEPRPGHDLSNILHSWKSFTSNQANQVLGRTGTFWQAESFDHLIRDAEDFDRALHYTLDNPKQAGLKDWQWVGCGKAFQGVRNRGVGFQPMTHGQDAHATDHGQDARATGWEHWQVPFDTDPDWPEALQEAVTEYRKAWRAKMDEVNACIAANAEQEELVDQPEVVKGVVRVSGPFTVEAVQPPEMSLGDNLDPHTSGDGKFDGEPDALPDGFEPRTLRIVEPARTWRPRTSKRTWTRCSGCCGWTGCGSRTTSRCGSAGWTGWMGLYRAWSPKAAGWPRARKTPTPRAVQAWRWRSVRSTGR